MVKGAPKQRAPIGLAPSPPARLFAVVALGCGVLLAALPKPAASSDGGRADSGTVNARTGTSAAAIAGESPFVRVRGNQLILGQTPFRFVGANLAIMHGPDARAEPEQLLGNAARDGIRVGRIWALGEGAVDATPWQREQFLFRAGPDGWIDAATEHLDRVIAAAHRVGIRLIITLSNSWPDFGGVPQYLRWSGIWHDNVYGAADRFYVDPRARAAFRAHVERLVTRTNRISGVAYRDDPTILGWELMNESRVETAAGATARRAWVIEMARLIHRLDPNHLVTPGVSGYRLARERREWLAICALPEVDYCDGHLYPEDMLAQRGPEALDAMLDDYVQLATQVAGKPFILGEFGIRGDAAGLWAGKSRAFWIARIFDRLAFDGAAGGLVWIYQSAPGAERSHAISVVDPSADEIRRAMRAAAERAAAPAPVAAQLNPRLGPGRGTAPLFPFRAEVTGPGPSVPVAASTSAPSSAPSRTPAAKALKVSWDPVAFVRADWETTGIWAGGAIEHVWGAESGFFEYAYEVPDGALGGGAGGDGPGRLTLRARVSSEYPGTLSPPDGASAFQVSLDGLPLGKAVAVRDDGQGKWIALRASGAALLATARRPGRHALRFTVPNGPRAHGLCIYGKPGEKPAPGSGSTGPIELTLEGR